MPRHTSALRRAGAATIALGTAVGSLLLATATPAAAVPTLAEHEEGASFNTSGGGCSVSNPGSSNPTTPFGAGAAAPISYAGSAVATGAAPGDITSLAATVSGSALLTEAAGGVTSFDVSARVGASVTRNLGAASACSSSVNTGFGVQGQFSTTAAGLLDLDFDLVGPGFSQTQVSLIRMSPTGLPSLSQSVSFGEKGRTHRVLPVEPGDYQFEIQSSVYAEGTNSTPAPPALADLRVRLHGDFKAFGVADGATKGTGTKYLTLSDAQNCGTHSVVGDFTNKAGKKAKKGKKPTLNKATFFVNGAKVSAVKKPNKKTVVTVGGLVADEPVEVEALIKVRGKGVVSVRRTYLPCS